MFAEAVRQSPPCFRYVDFLPKRAGYAIDDICGDAGEMVTDFNGSIGSPRPRNGPRDRTTNFHIEALHAN